MGEIRQFDLYFLCFWNTCNSCYIYYCVEGKRTYIRVFYCIHGHFVALKRPNDL